jgi:hypothetical protein
LNKSNLSEVMQQIRSINQEDKPPEPDDNNSESGPVPEVESTSSKPDPERVEAILRYLVPRKL